MFGHTVYSVNEPEAALSLSLCLWYFIKGKFQNKPAHSTFISRLQDGGRTRGGGLCVYTDTWCSNTVNADEQCFPDVKLLIQTILSSPSYSCCLQSLSEFFFLKSTIEVFHQYNCIYCCI